MEQTYKIGGMDCAHCAQTVEKGVSSLRGVAQVRVDFPTATLKFDGEVADDVLRQRVESLGYTLEIPTTERHIPSSGGVIGFVRFLWRGTTSRFALIGGACLLLGALFSVAGVAEALANAVFLLATGIALFPLARSGVNNLIINRDFNINMLMTIAAVGAALIGETAEAATVVFLFTIGESLEGYTTERARESIRSLMALVPPTAIRLSLGMLQEVVPVEQINIDDTILIKPGERIPVDGVILTGESSLDQAPVTGESVPVYKTVGAEVYAGTINGSGALTARVTHTAADHTIARIIRLVEDAQSVRAPSQTLIDRFARVYTPAVVIVALLVAVLPPLLFRAPFFDLPDGTHGWLYRALSLLVIACPCALVISIPVTVIASITAAARRGVLIKGGAFLERLATAQVVAFDKTGTLTRGAPVVTAARSVECMTGAVCPLCDDVLALANAVETQSAHPLARAVTDAAARRGLENRYAPAAAVESLAGRGARGRVAGSLVTVGSHALFDADYPHSADLCAEIAAVEARGQTAMLIASGDDVRGYISVEDTLRPESAAVLRELRALGKRSVMLTGDNPAVARAVADRLGVDDARAQLLPEDKAAAVAGLVDQYGSVVMVGDGINDAPALARATVGVAMGGAGSAQALETADVALMSDDLTGLPFALRLARFARVLMMQNIAASFAIKLIFVLLALFGATSLWLAILADVGMLLVVTLNGMRPLRFKTAL